MRNLIFLLLILVTNAGKAQQNSGPFDSLKKILQTQSTTDTNRIWTLLRLANTTFTANPAEAIKFADEGLKLSGQLKWKKGIALSYKVKGGVEYTRGDYLNALDYSQKALSSYPEADDFFRNSILNNIGNIYSELKQYDKVMPVYRENLRIARKANNKEEECMALYGIGTTYHLLKQEDSAILYMNQSYTIAQSINNKRLANAVVCGLSVVYRETKQYKESLDYAVKSIEIAAESDNKYILSPSYHNLALANFYLGDYESAEKNSKKSLDIAKEMGGLEWQADAWKAFYMIYEKTNQPLLALDAFKSYILLRDSLSGDEKKQEITRKEMMFQAEKKEAVLNAQHNAQISRQKAIKNFIAGGAAIVLAGGLFSFIFYRKKRNAVVRQNEAELKAEITDTEMKALRAQMNPHFIFNSLNSISDYIANNNTKVADEYLTKFAKLMRLVLENSEKKEVALSEDLKALELYVQLEALRLNNKFTYEIKVDDTIDKEVTLVPPLILQPFVENSIWHGIAKKQGEGNIFIHIKKEGDMINCIVEDNGVGRQGADGITSLKDNTGRRSLGMKITKERIDIINKVKKTNALVKLTDLQQGTRVELRLPLELSF